jgi:hypothetical protein
MTTQRKTKTMTETTTQTVWTKINTKRITEAEYVCKYKGYTFLMEDYIQSYTDLKGVKLYVIKDYERKEMTEIFKFQYCRNESKNSKIIVEGISIKTDEVGNCKTPWEEVGKKAIQYIDAISNDKN